MAAPYPGSSPPRRSPEGIGYFSRRALLPLALLTLAVAPPAATASPDAARSGTSGSSTRSLASGRAEPAQPREPAQPHEPPPQPPEPPPQPPAPQPPQPPPPREPSRPPTPAEVADNRVEPLDDESLQERARGLFTAIAGGDAELAEPFWFPREPFERLKDIPEPGKYWEQLRRAYLRDVRVVHGRRKSWDGATFVRFELTRRASWVAPGREANKIGYHRSLHGRIVYTLDGRERSLDVHTVITWQGHWYVTHLNPFR